MTDSSSACCREVLDRLSLRLSLLLDAADAFARRPAMAEDSTKPKAPLGKCPSVGMRQRVRALRESVEAQPEFWETVQRVDAMLEELSAEHLIDLQCPTTRRQTSRVGRTHSAHSPNASHSTSEEEEDEERDGDVWQRAMDDEGDAAEGMKWLHQRFLQHGEEVGGLSNRAERSCAALESNLDATPNLIGSLLKHSAFEDDTLAAAQELCRRNAERTRQLQERLARVVATYHSVTQRTNMELGRLDLEIEALERQSPDMEAKLRPLKQNSMRRACLKSRGAVAVARCASRSHHSSFCCVGANRSLSCSHMSRNGGSGSSRNLAAHWSGARTATFFFRPALFMARRGASVDLLSPLAKLGQSRDLAADIKAGRQRSNKEIIASFEKIQTFDEIHYRQTNRPWELVPKYAKRRVSDLCGILTSEDRMEIEQTIDRMQSICNVDPYVVLVPTVGYTTPKAFANSIMFDWGIGDPKGNGLLLLIAQHEATVHLVASPAIEEYFDTQFLEPAVREVFQPLVREGRASYATLQLVYAIARQAQEMRPLWERGLLALPTRNRVRFAAKAVHYGVASVPYLLIGVIFFAFCTTVLVNQLLDTFCPVCHGLMDRVRDDATFQAVMEPGQYLEFVNGCAHYRVWKCPKCADCTRVILTSRDLHQSTRCLQCVDCKYYTSTLTKEVVKLPSKEEDGVKQLLYKCENCHIGREVLLPLYRPVDVKPDEKWYDFLVERSQTHKKADLKL